MRAAALSAGALGSVRALGQTGEQVAKGEGNHSASNPGLKNKALQALNPSSYLPRPRTGSHRKRREVAMQPIEKVWLRGVDLNHRPLGYEPNELPDCSTPQHYRNVHIASGQTFNAKKTFNLSRSAATVQ